MGVDTIAATNPVRTPVLIIITQNLVLGIGNVRSSVYHRLVTNAVTAATATTDPENQGRKGFTNPPKKKLETPEMAAAINESRLLY